MNIGLTLAVQNKKNVFFFCTALGLHYLCVMILHDRHIRSLLFAVTGSICLLILQSAWMHHAYLSEQRQIMSDIKDAFDEAYKKEQTYRIPVVDIVNPGEITIQSCGAEEILIVRNCPNADTIHYNNISGHSIESFINHVFRDLREQIVPLHLDCLADLFAGMLYDKGIPVSFVIERFNMETGEVLETTLISGKEQSGIHRNNTIVTEISEKEAVRAILHVTPENVLGNMAGFIICDFCLIVIILLCICFLYRNYRSELKIGKSSQIIEPSIPSQNNTFHIGQYLFDPGKNELTGFGISIQLNKKENTILYALCAKQGNVVERKALLEENWGSLGLIYSRSLDTYLTTLRKYLKKDPSVQIVTVKGVGYKLVTCKSVENYD
jgi:DNA-binding winged helix-turn-helix (wHTH) protein